MTDELLNEARDKDRVESCTEGLVDHDYRPFTVEDGWYPGKDRTYLRCVWCHAVACGNYDAPDPCIEVWHHEPKPHRAASGATWPIGGGRHDPA